MNQRQLREILGSFIEESVSPGAPQGSLPFRKATGHRKTGIVEVAQQGRIHDRPGESVIRHCDRRTRTAHALCADSGPVEAVAENRVHEHRCSKDAPHTRNAQASFFPGQDSCPGRLFSISVKINDI